MLILTADWHLTNKTPLCRTDDFPKNQMLKALHVFSLSIDKGYPILHAGDLFDHWKPPYEVLNNFQAIKGEAEFFSIAGNHDLPDNSISQSLRSAYGCLECSDIFHFGTANIHRDKYIIQRAHFGQPIPEPYKGMPEKRKVLMCHTLIEPSNAKKFLRDHCKGYDLVLVGDNHEAFQVNHKGQLLVSPGSLMRITAAQMNYHPAVWIWNPEHNTADLFPIPKPEGAISRDHIDKKKERDGRIASYVERLSGDLTVDLSFRDNLTQYLAANNIKRKVCKQVMRIVDAQE